MPSIENEWDLVDRHRTCDLHPTASKDKLWVRIQAIWNCLPHAEIQHLFDSTPCCTEVLIATRIDYTKY
ncbi:hypothetical protein TNCV_1397301 [Trichonephila clavipes]|nr:hypothetical protein TNCV_1397301 [Trichonephila clavipes]